MTVELISNRAMIRLTSRHPEVKAAVAREGRARQARAEATLAAHRHDGHSEITGYQGVTDYNIEMNDDRGQRAVISIEYGRPPKFVIGPDGKPKLVKGSIPVGALAAAMTGGGPGVDV